MMKYIKRNELYSTNEFILAGINKRFMALFFDWIILIVIYYILLNLLKLVNINIKHLNLNNFTHVELEMEHAKPSTITILKLILGFVPVIYFTAMLYFNKGQTIGKKLLKIKVISLYHEKIGIWHSLERSLGYVASTLELGLGFVQVFWNPNRMTLHDKISETIVIDISRKRNGQ